MRRILVTYAWCRTAYCVVESLARAGFEIYVCDASPLSMSRFSHYTQGFDRVASFLQEPERFIRDLIKVVEKRRINILLPIHEDSLVISRHKEHFPPDLLIVCPPYEQLRIAMDKNLIIDVAVSCGVSAPKKIAPANHTEALKELGYLSYPIIIKSRRGNSGKGVFMAKTFDEAVHLYNKMIKLFMLSEEELPIIQEYIEGDLFGTCFLAERGKILACFVEKYLRWKESRFGTSVLREPYHWPLLEEYTQRMVKALDWTGIGHFDFVGNHSASRAYLLEMNPRFWGAINLAIRNGYDFPLGLISMYLNGRPYARCFRPTKVKFKSLWVVGEMIAGLGEFRQKKWLSPLSSLARIFFPLEYLSYDDFRWSDPLPFLAEMIYYASHYIKAGYQINPIVIEMMRW